MMLKSLHAMNCTCLTFIIIIIIIVIILILNDRENLWNFYYNFKNNSLFFCLKVNYCIFNFYKIMRNAQGW